MNALLAFETERTASLGINAKRGEKKPSNSIQIVLNMNCVIGIGIAGGIMNEE